MPSFLNKELWIAKFAHLSEQADHRKDSSEPRRKCCKGKTFSDSSSQLTFGEAEKGDPTGRPAVSSNLDH